MPSHRELVDLQARIVNAHAAHAQGDPAPNRAARLFAETVGGTLHVQNERGKEVALVHVFREDGDEVHDVVYHFRAGKAAEWNKHWTAELHTVKRFAEVARIREERAHAAAEAESDATDPAPSQSLATS